MKSSQCPSVSSEDEQAGIKLRAESVSGWKLLKETHWSQWIGGLRRRSSDVFIMWKDFTLSLQAIIQSPLTTLKASGTCDNSERLQKTSENFAELAKCQPNPPSPHTHTHTSRSPWSCPPSSPLTSALELKRGQDDNDPTGSHSAPPL